MLRLDLGRISSVMRRQIIFLALVLLASSVAMACNRCGRLICRRTKCTTCCERKCKTSTRATQRGPLTNVSARKGSSYPPSVTYQSNSLATASFQKPTLAVQPAFHTYSPIAASGTVPKTFPTWPSNDILIQPVQKRIENFLPSLSPQDQRLLQPEDDQPTLPWEAPEEQPIN